MKWAISFLVLALVLGSCSQQGGGGGGDGGDGGDSGSGQVGIEIEGTWVLSSGGVTETLIITTTTFMIEDTGAVSGHMECSITAYDENAKHIKMSVTSVSGAYSVVSIGTVWYVLYSKSGDTLYLGMGGSGYPTSTPYGPYTKS